jgi:hypothetical protein
MIRNKNERSERTLENERVLTAEELKRTSGGEGGAGGTPIDPKGPPLEDLWATSG